MALVPFTSRMLTGIGSIDRQHRQLVETINRLHEAIQPGQEPAQLTATLDFLEHYASEHFAHEERLLAQVGYGDLGAHRRAHREFKDRLAELVSAHRAGARVSAAEVTRFLSYWIQEHILRSDLGYAALLRAHRVT